MAKRPLGLALRSKHLLYQFEGGHLYGWPPWVQDVIVRVFNFFACRLFGHKIYDIQGDQPPFCCHCSKRFPGWKR